MTPYGAAVAIQGYLADGGNSPSDVDPTTGKGPEWGEAAPAGLLVIVLLCVAVYFLVKSMNRNLKKVPESFATVGVPATVGASAAGASGAAASGAAAPVTVDDAGGATHAGAADATAGPSGAETPTNGPDVDRTPPPESR